jgi:hypothetical protein
VLPIHLVSAPSFAIVRIAGARHQPFTAAPWRFDPRTGALRFLPVNRFDDSGPSTGLPRNAWFQTIYAATNPQGAFGELLAHRRLSGPAAAGVAGIARALAGPISKPDNSEDPLYPSRGTVPANWRHEKQITTATVNTAARFVDVSHPATLSFLLGDFVPYLQHNDLMPVDGNDFDLSDVMSRNRTLTQHLARYLHELPADAIGSGKAIAGIRYLSRHSPEWECWAFFADRIDGKLEIGESRPIAADDPELLAVARQFGLSVETDTPGEYLRPWLSA